VHCGKTADRIWMRFGMVGRMGPGMRHAGSWVWDRSTGGEILGVNVGHPIVTPGEFSA